jgi:hypothetical protein
MSTEIFQLHAVNGERRGYRRKSFNLKNLCDLRVLSGENYGLEDRQIVVKNDPIVPHVAATADVIILIEKSRACTQPQALEQI